MKQLLLLLEPGDRGRLAIMVVGSVLAALAEVVALLAVRAFLASVSLPGSLPGWSVPELAVGCLVAVSFSNLLAGLSLAFNLSFIWGLEISLSARLLRSYLEMPYARFVSQRMADVSKNILTPSLTERVLFSLSVVVSKLALIAAILATLLAVDWSIALRVCLAFGAAYWLVHRILGRAARTWGRRTDAARTRRIEWVNRSLAAQKSVRLWAVEDYFVERFRESNREACRLIALHDTLTEIPRYALETVALGGIVVLSLHFGKQPGAALPMVGLYAMAAYRLLPSLHIAFTHWSRFRFHYPVLENYHEMLSSSREVVASEPLPFEQEVTMEEVGFSYTPQGPAILTAASFRLPKGKWLGLLGPTGTGKSTLVDLLAGLLAPDQGVIRVDGELLGPSRLASWRKQLGYVPQDVALLDDTVASNIAFGIAGEGVDLAAVERAARIAQIHEVIERLPDGYATRVGERGVLLSGGQRQRLGLARALYRDPGLLILDESTSALDPTTEQRVMEAMKSLQPPRTVVIVSHRPSLVGYCDLLFRLEQGRLVACAG